MISLQNSIIRCMKLATIVLDQEKCIMITSEAKTCKDKSCNITATYIADTLWRNYVSCCMLHFLIKNSSCEFLADYGVILEKNHQSYGVEDVHNLWF